MQYYSQLGILCGEKAYEMFRERKNIVPDETYVCQGDTDKDPVRYFMKWGLISYERTQNEEVNEIEKVIDILDEEYDGDLEAEYMYETLRVGYDDGDIERLSNCGSSFLYSQTDIVVPSEAVRCEGFHNDGSYNEIPLLDYLCNSRSVSADAKKIVEKIINNEERENHSSDKLQLIISCLLAESFRLRKEEVEHVYYNNERKIIVAVPQDAFW